MQKFRVIVSALPEQRVELVKALRSIGNIGLQGAVDLINCIAEHMPGVLMDGIDKGIAEEYQTTLERAGATVQVEESETVLPLLLSPQINERDQWGGLRRRKIRW
ncbi:ribosomal protein L7/L12 [Gemmatimonadota bacterium]